MTFVHFVVSLSLKRLERFERFERLEQAPAALAITVRPGGRRIVARNIFDTHRS